MQSPEWAFAYHNAPPSVFPVDNWQRAEIRYVKELCPVAKAITSAMMDLEYPRKDVFAIDLALREVVVNAIKHGHGGDPNQTVLVHYHIDPNEVLLEVADEGHGFDPHHVLNPMEGKNPGRFTGMGLFLLRVYMTWIRFNKRGNRVVLCKRRSER
jgi:anti-sigma regulatory factor (Ser/Thr protein kinase)